MLRDGADGATLGRDMLGALGRTLGALGRKLGALRDTGGGDALTLGRDTLGALGRKLGELEGRTACPPLGDGALGRKLSRGAAVIRPPLGGALAEGLPPKLGRERPGFAGRNEGPPEGTELTEAGARGLVEVM